MLKVNIASSISRKWLSYLNLYLAAYWLLLKYHYILLFVGIKQSRILPLDLSTLGFTNRNLAMEMTSFINSEQLNNRRDCRSNCTSSFENGHILQGNVERGRTASNESHRNSQDVTDWLHRLYQVTDVVLIICAVTVVVSVFISLAIFIFGTYRIQRGLEGFVLSS